MKANHTNKVQATSIYKEVHNAHCTIERYCDHCGAAMTPTTILSRERWWRICRLFKHFFQQDILDFLDHELTALYDSPKIHIDTLTALLAPQQDESLEQAADRIYGRQATLFLKELL